MKNFLVTLLLYEVILVMGVPIDVENTFGGTQQPDNPFGGSSNPFGTPENPFGNSDDSIGSSEDTGNPFGNDSGDSTNPFGDSNENANPFGENPIESKNPFEGPTDNADPIKDPFSSNDEESDPDVEEAPVPKTLPCGKHAPINGDFEDVKVNKFKIYHSFIEEELN